MHVKWQEMALNSQAPITIAKVARRGGKSMTAMMWARERKHEVVAFICRSRRTAEQAADTMRALYNHEHHDFNRGGGVTRLMFQDGTTIIFGDTWAQFRGMNIESFVMDDVEHLTNGQWNYLTRRLTGKVLFVGTRLNDTIDEILENRQGSVHHIVADYMDLIHDGLFDREDIEKVKQAMSFDTFKQELGTWRRPKELTNEDYLCLLHT